MFQPSLSGYRSMGSVSQKGSSWSMIIENTNVKGICNSCTGLNSRRSKMI